jgi:anhydro-N-acetylmuramic acid kinase
MSEIYIGIMSGTSLDGIDVVAVDFEPTPLKILGTYVEPFANNIKKQLHKLCSTGSNEINRYGQLDRQLGSLFANACLQLISKANLKRDKIQAIGSHGQTIRHHPNIEHPFTLQIGDPHIIAAKTKITTIADFRRRDMAYGGQGAPLAPAFHQFAFQSPYHNRVVVNIGGISNLTFLPTDTFLPVKGFDCGPGNTLLDQWVKKHLHEDFDKEGEWASKGKINIDLLNSFLKDPYFKLLPPKSTGKEYFNIKWLERHTRHTNLAPQDIQSTLSELTAYCIAEGINHFGEENEILLCGGGSQNKDLVKRISKRIGKNKLCTTEKFGIHPDWVESIAFAWLARQTYLQLPGNLPAVTGASARTILGAIYPAG